MLNLKKYYSGIKQISTLCMVGALSTGHSDSLSTEIKDANISQKTTLIGTLIDQFKNNMQVNVSTKEFGEQNSIFGILNVRRHNVWGQERIAGVTRGEGGGYRYISGNQFGGVFGHNSRHYPVIGGKPYGARKYLVGLEYGSDRIQWTTSYFWTVFSKKLSELSNFEDTYQGGSLRISPYYFQKMHSWGRANVFFTGAYTQVRTPQVRIKEGNNVVSLERIGVIHGGVGFSWELPYYLVLEGKLNVDSRTAYKKPSVGINTRINFSKVRRDIKGRSKEMAQVYLPDYFKERDDMPSSPSTAPEQAGEEIKDRIQRLRTEMEELYNSRMEQYNNAESESRPSTPPINLKDVEEDVEAQKEMLTNVAPEQSLATEELPVEQFPPLPPSDEEDNLDIGSESEPSVQPENSDATPVPALGSQLSSFVDVKPETPAKVTSTTEKGSGKRGGMKRTDSNREKNQPKDSKAQSTTRGTRGGKNNTGRVKIPLPSSSQNPVKKDQPENSGVLRKWGNNGEANATVLTQAKSPVVTQPKEETSFFDQGSSPSFAAVVANNSSSASPTENTESDTIPSSAQSQSRTLDEKKTLLRNQAELSAKEVADKLGMTEVKSEAGSKLFSEVVAEPSDSSVEKTEHPTTPKRKRSGLPRRASQTTSPRSDAAVRDNGVKSPTPGTDSSKSGLPVKSPKQK